MSEKEVMALVNPMKGMAIVFWIAWMVTNAFIANRSRYSKQEENTSGAYLFGGVATALMLFLGGPFLLGIQFAIFFQGMSRYDARDIPGGWLFIWALLNFVVALIILATFYGDFKSTPNDFAAAYMTSSSLAITFAGAAALGFGTLFGAISPDTFFALKVYTQEWLSNGFFLLCFVGVIVAVFGVLSS